MTQVNQDDDTTTDQVRCRPGNRAQDLGEQARPQAQGGAAGQGPGAGPVRHTARRPRGARAAHGHDSRRASRARKGAAAVNDQGYHRPGGARPGDQASACNGPPAGSPDGDGARQDGSTASQATARGMASAAAARAHPAGAASAPRGGTDPGEAQPVLTGHAKWGSKTFGSLQTRNYRLFAAGQVVSNTGSWMQRVAQDWLVLQLTHDSGTALGITTGLQFLPLLLFSLWGGVIADRYPKRRILMATQSAMGVLALILGVLGLTGAVRIWQVYALAFALGLATVVDNPTRQAFAAEMVGRNGMANAIAL